MKSARFGKWSQQILIGISFFLALFFVSVIGFSSLKNISALMDAAEWRRHTYTVLLECDKFILNLTQAETAHRTYLVSGEVIFLRAFNTSAEAALKSLASVSSMTKDNPTQQDRFEVLTPLVKSKIEGMKAQDKVRKEQGYAPAKAMFLGGKGRLWMKKINRITEEIKSEEHVLLALREKKMKLEANKTRWTIIIGTSLSFLIVAGASFLINRDITRRRRAEVLLEKNKENLEIVNKELEAFSYSVSHDLRAPLRHIDGFVDMLLKGSQALDEKSRRYLRIISDSAKQMGNLIDDLLVFSRMGRTEMRRSYFDVTQAVKDVLAGMRRELEGRKIEWNVGSLPTVEADPSMMKLVLVNLLSNAVKYTGKKEVAKIEVGSQVGQGGEKIFFVRDNGAGFNMDYQEKLFGVFQRLHSADDFEGTGIGLANVKRIISRHGGKVWAEGAVDQGAAFYFSLPK